jgi:hypothetical protein
MTKIYIAIVGILVVVGIVIYSTMSYKDNQHQKHEVSYRNEINHLKADKEVLVVERKETKAIKDFVIKEKKIIKKSVETKTYTKKMMEDKNVENFDDSF